MDKRNATNPSTPRPTLLVAGPRDRRRTRAVAFEEPGTRKMQLRTLELRADIVSNGCLEPLRRGSGKSRLGLVANPLAIGLQKRRERGPPQGIPGRDRVAVNLRIGFINVSAKRREHLHRCRP